MIFYEGIVLYLFVFGVRYSFFGVFLIMVLYVSVFKSGERLSGFRTMSSLVFIMKFDILLYNVNV